MDRNITLTDGTGVVLQSIRESDLENLRRWKNMHRHSFFFQGILSPPDQRKWFREYLGRPDDYMFVVCCEGESIGCIGFRYIDGKVDVYNVIRGVAGKPGTMGLALHRMCDYALQIYPGILSVKVLRGNPAIAWYECNGFRETGVFEDYVELELT